MIRDKNGVTRGLQITKHSIWLLNVNLTGLNPLLPPLLLTVSIRKDANIRICLAVLIYTGVQIKMHISNSKYNMRKVF